MPNQITLYPVIDYESIGFRHEYGPWYQKNICPYCGCELDSSNTTVDHIPSKVLIDKPYPAELATIPCCRSCNKGFSSDEEYASVLVECVKNQTFNPNAFSRESIKKTVSHTPSLIETVRQRVIFESKDRFSIDPDDNRFKAVLLKLVKAHLRFEESLFLINSTDIKLLFSSIDKMSDLEVSRFAMPFSSRLLPEVGSRALENLMILQDDNNQPIGYYSPWICYQKDTYSYCVASAGDKVKILLHGFICVSAELFESTN